MSSAAKASPTVWLGRAISTLAVLPFVMSAFMKFQANPQLLEQMKQVGIPESLLPILGILEILCVVIYAIPRTAVLGAILFTGYVGGTIITHLRIEQPVYLQVTLGVLVWLGIYLREPRLHQVLPLRK
jgi:hypothetical protein